MASDDWKVLGNGPLEKLAENLWHVTGALSFGTLTRAMTVVKKTGGALVIHSAIALDEDRMNELESLGTPKFLLVPSAFHRLDAPAYKKRYPDVRVFAPAGSRKKIEQVVAVDGTFDDFPACDAVRLDRLDGIGDLEGAMLVRSADGLTVVLTDVVFNMDAKKDFAGWLFTSLMGSAPGPRVSRLAKLAIVKDKKALRKNLERLADLPDLQRVIVAHEKVASGADAAKALRTAATFL